MTRTIEQILGLTPMNQNDLVASPMSDIFINAPPAKNFLPWTHVAERDPAVSGRYRDAWNSPSRIAPR